MRRFLPLLSLSLLLSALPSGLAQEAPSPSASPVSSAPSRPEPEEDSAATFKVNSSLVSLFFTASGKNNQPLTNLKKEDCSVYEDRVEQTIKTFTQEMELPLTIGLLLDTSGSQQRVLPLEQQTGAAFLKRVLTKKDEAFLISFDVNVDLLTDYTNNANELTRAINKATINAGVGSGGIPGIGQGPIDHQNPRGTLLYDAVYLAAHDKLHQEAGRKVMILLTDGEDSGSQETVNTALEAAQKSNAIIYVILIADRGGYFNAGMGYSGDSVMRKFAQDTGGRLIDVGNNGKKLEDAFEQIEDELRTQYLISYVPLDGKLDGGFRQVNVTCKGASKVQTRKGYYAVADSTATE